MKRGTWTGSGDGTVAPGDGIVVGIADSWLHPVPPALALPGSRVRAFACDGSVTEPVPLPSSHGTAVASLIASAELGVAPRTSLVFASVLRQVGGDGWGGTSMAAAIAAGAIAAMMGIHQGLDGGNVHAHLARTARRHASGERCLRG